MEKERASYTKNGYTATKLSEIFPKWNKYIIKNFYLVFLLFIYLCSIVITFSILAKCAILYFLLYATVVCNSKLE